jgi:hypothetical protein
MADNTSIKKYDNFTVNTIFVKVSTLQVNDFGIQFMSQNIKYILKYIGEKLHFYVGINNIISTDVPLSHVCNLFNEIKEIENGNFHFEKCSFQIIGKNNVKFTESSMRTALGIRFICQSNGTSILICNFDFGDPMEIYVSNKDNFYHSKFIYDNKQCQARVKLLSLCYILNSKARNKIVAHCLQHFNNTYFNIIPTDILHFIFDYVIG